MGACVRVCICVLEHKLVLFSRQLELDPASVSSPDLLLLLQYQSLQTRYPVLGHRWVHVLHRSTFKKTQWSRSQMLNM